MISWNCPECGIDVIEPRKRGPHVSGCRRTAKAQFVYDDVSDPYHKHPLAQATCETCNASFLGRVNKGIKARFCSKSCAQTGKNNTMSKDTYNPSKAHVIPSYYSLHAALSKTKGSAKTYRCFCGERGQVWANLTGKYEDTEDYTPMCGRCHNRYDKGRAMMGDTMGWTEYLKLREGNQ